MKLKKLFFIMMICIFLNRPIAFAETEKENIFCWEMKDNISCELEIFSKHCICIERTTEQTLFEKDAYSPCAMASTTKILTGIIVIENCNLNDEVIISPNAASTGGSTLGIFAGQKITIENLLYGLLLRSGNDAAVALAEHISGSVEIFSECMNQKAKAIGLKNSHFITPHGLDQEEHYTTAYDLALLTNYALKNPTFLNIVGTKQITIQIGNDNRILNNTNELLGIVDGVYGVKTGFTGNAGRCLVTACKRNDLDIIVVVLGADSKKMRAKDSQKVIEYVFQNFLMVDTEKEIVNSFQSFQKHKTFEVCKSLNNVEYDYENVTNYICPIDKRKIAKLRTSIYCLEKLDAPLKQDIIIGKIRLICEDKILYELNIYLNKKINRIDWKNYLVIFVKKYITFYKI